MPAKDDSAVFSFAGSDTAMDGPLVFHGFPGIWYLGDEKSAKELGFETDEEARDALEASGAPLKEVGASKKTATKASEE